MTCIIPSRSAFDSILDAPNQSTLSVEATARKLVAACDPARVGDNEHLISVLVASGVKPSDVDMTRWSEIRAAARAMVGVRAAAEAVEARGRSEYLGAIVATVAMIILALAQPALAADAAPLPSNWRAFVAIAVGGIAIGWAAWRYVWPLRVFDHEGER